jgi:DNA-binding response OmpR family regulator
MTRILVIESESRARHALERILAGAGYEVHTAKDDRQAEEMHAAKPADLVIADDLAERIFARTRALAVPSGATCRDTRERMQAAGAHILPKPFHRDDLLAAVQASLSRAPAAPNHQV